MQSMFRYLTAAFLNYLMLSDIDGNLNGIEKWRISALRIMIITGYTFYSFIALHSCISAAQLDFNLVIPLTLGFYLCATLQLWLSVSHYTISAYSLLITIVVSAISINIIARDPALAMFGPVYVFSLPLVAFILLGARVGFICMLLNILPFIALLSGFQLSQYFPPHPILENGNIYIISMIFLFFNICAPLGVARSSLAARRLNQKLIEKNQELQTQNDFYKTLFVDTDVAKIVVNNGGLIKEINLAAKQLLKCDSLQSYQPTYIAELFSDFPTHIGEMIVNRSVEGKMKAFKLTRSDLFNHDDFFLTIHDITAKVMLNKTLAAQTIINRQQKLDKQTGLPNRQWLADKLNGLLPAKGNELCIIALKLGNAQFIEQKYGFQILPTLVKALAKFWHTEHKNLKHWACVDNANLIVVTELSVMNIRVTLQTFMARLPKAIEVEGHSVPVDLQAGVSSPDSTKCSAEKLINNALYAVNSSQSKINFYETSSLERFIEHQEINILLDEAMSTNELRIVYQPKVEKDGRLLGLEALLRWNSSVIGLVSPAIFVPIAEKSGLVPKITQWLITNICNQISSWKHQGFDLVPIALNISGIDLDSDDFQKHLIHSLLEHNINPKLIEIELTESATSSHKEKALLTSKVLTDWGFSICLDDFGKGYSGLSKLISYPVSRVKIDRQFIKDIHLDERKSKVVEAMIAMCRVLKIDVLAEGTEKLEEVEKLHLLGCTSYQGYVFSKPLEAEQIQPLLVAKNVFHNTIPATGSQIIQS
ncbi:EAL domain-containing protein [Aliiglaciecola sp. LCG003]|uniref:EAL domain-containing protein n=1 Tax=Aliiglaciecola sp. LCG003 TaxID=3053655 RepID=UPI002572DE7F|nr:EAL domain-containing protein [Aliiglaciecola sp. LCG003]WJG10292.1 EAL domain-containing protein [Aliiglaciecola sp. LCG003]